MSTGDLSLSSQTFPLMDIQAVEAAPQRSRTLSITKIVVNALSRISVTFRRLSCEVEALDIPVLAELDSSPLHARYGVDALNAAQTRE